ncbi:hypothetical protein LC653_39445 [Nostoc sp. CHAB 5784]|uniref:hypothetical protein n=1 Tax=Nostoc mirabile TaxID=2907820 RepID=UPI001E2C1BA6|nr:hypothetical protein [Nostoc mirabile]MCC5669724.1 hypothetical protein [Nostoc mirabile CHAB5784]
MTYPTYSQQQLQLKSIARLKQIYSEIACIVEVSDKRCKDAWISAIADYQSSKIQKLTPAAPDNQATAQAELDQFIADQAQAIVPESLTTVEINFYHHEVYCGKELIAYITYDHDDLITQPWLVMVNGKEEFRANTWAKCYRFIQWHHQDGTLNNSQLPSRNSQLNSITKSQEFGSLMHQSPHDINNCELRTANCELPQAEAPTILEISFYDQEAFVGDELVASISYDHGNYQNLYWRVLVNNAEIFRDLSAARCHSYIKQQYQQGTLPVQEQLEEEACSTGNEIMVQIFTECEKYGFEILDDGIYNNDVQLGEVGCTDGGWWVMRTAPRLQTTTERGIST